MDALNFSPSSAKSSSSSSSSAVNEIAFNPTVNISSGGSPQVSPSLSTPQSVSLSTPTSASATGPDSSYGGGMPWLSSSPVQPGRLTSTTPVSPAYTPTGTTAADDGSMGMLAMLGLGAMMLFND